MSAATVSVGRDPFARGGYLRECVNNPPEYGPVAAGTPFCTTRTIVSPPKHDCEWCGYQPRRLFRYRWSDDASGTRNSVWSPLFCNLSCFRNYYNA